MFVIYVHFIKFLHQVVIIYNNAPFLQLIYTKIKL